MQVSAATSVPVSPYLYTPLPQYQAVSQVAWQADQYLTSTPETKPPYEPGDPVDPGKGELGVMLKLGGIVAGGAAIGGTAGYFAGKAFGFSTTAGAVAGAGLGAVLPIGLIIYALKDFT